MIVSSVDFVRFNSKCILDCTGTPPFLWELKEGKGSISISGDSAIFEAPNDIIDGLSSVECLDSNNVTHEIKIGYGDELQVILDIIRKELDLSPEQIHLSYEKFNIPNDFRPYITGQILSSQFLNNSQREDEEIQTINISSTIQIDILSKGNISQNYCPRLVMALSSPYSKKQQLNSGMRLSNLPSQMNNTSFIEGSSGIYRFTTTFNLTYNKVLSKSQDYFDDFSDEYIVRY